MDKLVADGVVTEYTQSRKKHRPPVEENGRYVLFVRCAGQVCNNSTVQRTAFIATIVGFQISSAATNGYRYPQTEEKYGGKAGTSCAASPLRSDL